MWLIEKAHGSISKTMKKLKKKLKDENIENSEEGRIWGKLKPFASAIP